MIHSSLSSFGCFEGGASAVIRAIMKQVGLTGTILMPSFNHGAPFRDGGAGFYDPASTPTTNGIIPETFRSMPAVVRSLNPTHPFAAWGRDADEYVRDHHRTLTMGADSPLGRLWRDGGSMLLIGVDYRANTFHHLVETVTGAPCLGRRTEELPVKMPDGQIALGRTWGWRESPCPITDGNRYGDIMASEGRERVTRVGAARLIAFTATDCFDVVSRILLRGRDGYPPCRLCPIRSRVTSHTVASDLDQADAPPSR